MPKTIHVLKASGEYEPFAEKRVLSSLRRAGASEQLASKILSQVKPQLYQGIPTQEIYQQVFQFLNQIRSPVASRYNLKSAIMQLGPSGYPFEKFIAGLLAQYGYQTKTNLILAGKCVTHEIDVAAEKDNQKFMIECKFHNRPGVKTDIKVALYTYARLIDLSRHFDQAWLITNTKTSSQVLGYAACAGLKITSWDYPPHESLRFLVDHSHLYPLTCLNSLSNSEKRILLEKGIVFYQDLLKLKTSPLSPQRLEIAQDEAEKVIKTKA